MIYLLVVIGVLHGLNRVGATFIEPYEFDDEHELYCWEDMLIEINLKPVPYEGAKAVCNTRKGQLITLNNSDVYAFMGQVLEVSRVGYSALWVGARFKEGRKPETPGVWQWESTKAIIETVDVGKYPMEKMPFWVDRFDLKRKGSICLAIDRRKHEEALITGLPCAVSRPFICELPGRNSTDHPPVVIEVGHKKFRLINYYLTWEAALSYCSQHGEKLASLTNASDWDIIAEKMLRTRPVVESAWTSGKFRDGEWKWGSDEVIPLIDPDNFNMEAPHENVPPWYRKYNLKAGCLLADRHLCTKNVVLVEAKCERKKPFICENIIPTKTNQEFVEVVPSKSHLWISMKTVPWFVALNRCAECFNTGDLLRIEDNPFEQLLDIYTALTVSLNRDIRHVWVAGFLYEETFYWVTKEEFDKQENPPEENIITGKFLEKDEFNQQGLTGSVVRCELNVTEYQCLNMDREDQKKFFLYGLACEERQHYICQTKDREFPNENCGGPILGN